MTENLFPTGDELLGRVVDAAGAPLDGGPPLTNRQAEPPLPPATAAGAALWETGIKVIDVYAPIARGTTIALVARPGVGLMVTIAELLHRLAEQRGGCAVFAELDGERNELREVAGLLRESGTQPHAAVVGGDGAATAVERQAIVRSALSAAATFVAAGRDVLLVVDDSLIIAETAELLRGSARVTDAGSLTTLLCFWRHAGAEPAGGAAAALLAAADTRLVFSRALAQQAVWPAIDALASSSRLLDLTHVPDEQLRVVAAARALLAAGPDAADTLSRARAEKLLLFQAQPFFVAEPFTARPAAYVPRTESVAAFAGMLAGAYDQTPSEELRFIGGAQRPTLT